jgi:ABC-type sugar transport system ATPase subunit
MGIEMVFQDLGMCPDISIAENMFMGRELTRKFLGFKILDKRQMVTESARCLTDVGVNMPSAKTRVRNLSGGQQKAIAVMRAVYWDTKIVIMDEPTAALGVKEQHKVLEIMRNLREKNIGIIFISHNLDEVFSVADRIMVLSRGRKVSDTQKNQVTKDQIVAMLIA